MAEIDNTGADITQQNIGSIVHNYYGDKKIPQHLSSRPFLPELFMGRESDLSALRQRLFEQNNLLLLVNGRGGVGKTSLAARYYHEYEQDYQHLAWVLSEGNITQALLLLAPALELSFEDNMPSEARMQRLLAAMSRLDKPCLLVIDNANELEDLQAHYVLLRRCSNFHLLLTSRITNFQQAQSYKIEGLPQAEALALFKHWYPLHEPSQDALFLELYQAVWGNTLVIELLAKNLSSFNTHLKTRYQLRDLLAELQEKGLFALQTQPIQSSYQAKGTGLRKETPEDIIRAMYELSRLSEAERKALSIFAVLPAESIPFATLEVLLADTPNLDQTLLSLAQKGWLEAAAASFKISPVIQEVTQQKNEHLRADCQPLLDALIEKLAYEGTTGHFLNSSYQAAATYARYGEKVIGSFKQADNDLAILCERLGNYHKTTGNLAQALGFFEDETQLFAELYEAYPQHVGFKNGLAISYWKLGDYHRKLEHKPQAIGYFQAAEKLWGELVSAFPAYVEFQQNWERVKEDLGEL